MKDQCLCWQEVSELTYDWEPIKIWMYTFPSIEMMPAQLQVRDERNEIITSVNLEYCPLCGRYLR